MFNPDNDLSIGDILETKLLADIEQYVISRMRAKRLSSGWTQDDLSTGSGLSHGFIGDVESGTRDKNTILSM